MALQERTENPPPSEFKMEDLVWTNHVIHGKSRHKASKLIVIPWDILVNFLHGEQHRPFYPCTWWTLPWHNGQWFPICIGLKRFVGNEYKIAQLHALRLCHMYKQCNNTPKRWKNWPLLMALSLVIRSRSIHIWRHMLEACGGAMGEIRFTPINVHKWKLENHESVFFYQENPFVVP